MSSKEQLERLDNKFEAAADRISRSKTKVSDQTKLELYALYKQATVGSCNTSRPRFLDFTGKAKWDAWSALGSMSQDQAKLKYMMLERKIHQDGKTSRDDDDYDGGSSAATSGMLAPAVSRMAFQPEEECDFNSIWDLACDNKIALIRKLLDTEIVLVHARDENGCSALHLACDRGHDDLVRLLLDKYHANVNLQDNSGCTPLHYAVCCNRPEIAHILMSHGANPMIHDHEGHLPISSAGPEVAAVFSHYGN